MYRECLRTIRSGVAAASTVLFIGAGGTTAAIAQQSPAHARPAAPIVEGDWVRTDPAGSGSWDALTRNFTPASLTPAGAAMAAGGGRGGRGGGAPQPAADNKPHVAGQPYVVRNQTCSYAGNNQLGLEYDSEGFHMVIGKDEVVFVQERGGSRRVYLDGRDLPGASVRPPTSSGYSVGHFEADGTLVVETTDMTPGTVTAGGYHTPETRVIQRYIPSSDGKHLRITFEWIDPKIYQKPHTYEYTFDRMEPGSYALETFCDATDPLWGQSVVPPPQN